MAVILKGEKLKLVEELVFATVGGKFTSTSNTVHKSVYIMNSKLPQNVADIGGVAAVKFKLNCFASNVLIHNVITPFKEYSNYFQWREYTRDNCSAGSSVAISRSSPEFGNSSGTGGGITILTGASEARSSTVGSLKPTIVNIVDSSLQYNTAQYQGGGLVISFNSSDYFY